MNILLEIAKKPTAGILTEVSEVFYAAIVSGLILIILAIPGAKSWWETTGWKRIIIFGLCLLSAISVWAIECPLDWADIPGYAPRCNMEGIILDVLYAAFLDWALRWAGEEAVKLVQKARKRSPLTRYFTSTGFALFLLTVVIEFVLLCLGLPWQTGLAISVTAAILVTLLGMFLTNFPFAIRANPLLRTALWWLALILKVVVHTLPIPFFLKPIINIVLTIIVFVLVNFIL